MKRHFVKVVSIVLLVAAVAVPMARATEYDGYKSGYPQLHAVLTHQLAARPLSATNRAYDGYKSDYPQLHAVLSHEVATPLGPTANRGFDWRDAAIGAATAAAFIFLLAGGALLLNRRRTRLAL